MKKVQIPELLGGRSATHMLGRTRKSVRLAPEWNGPEEDPALAVFFFLHVCEFRCEECGHAQLRGYDKKPFDPGGGVVLYMICKGTCRRKPASKLERKAVRGQLVTRWPVFLGLRDGMVPDTRHHRMTAYTYQHAEAERRAQLR